MLPSGACDGNDTQALGLPKGIQSHSQKEGGTDFYNPLINRGSSPNYAHKEKIIPIESSLHLENHRVNDTHGGENEDLMPQDINEEAFNSRTQSSGGMEHGTSHSENILNDRSTIVAGNDQSEAEWIEQYEPGVYISFISLGGDAKDLKRVRFR